jgi:DNA-binding response OmpR family regulator
LGATIMTLVVDHRLPRKVHFHAAQNSPAQTPIILCIDDDPNIQSAIEMRMRRYDVEVQHAFYGMQGIWDSVRGNPALIILDIAMPNGDGRYVLRCLRSNKNTARVPIIVLSGMRDPHLVRDVMLAGADQYLRKPISGDELVHQIGRFVTLQDKPEN